jgi:hypothetical protein
LLLNITSDPEGQNWLASASFSGNLTGEAKPTGTVLKLDQPVELAKGENYYLNIAYQGPRQGVILQGAAIANEGAWDDGLPVRLDGYDGFGGIYQPGLNFDMYEDDNPNKLARFLSILDQAEYLLIDSNGSGVVAALPERFDDSRILPPATGLPGRPQHLLVQTYPARRFQETWVMSG